MKRQIHDILIRPLLTEKAMDRQEAENRYCFEVRKDANKTEIKVAVENLFNVRVKKVNVMIVPGKWKRIGRYIGRTNHGWKKAVVALHEGYTIEVYEGV